MPARILLLAALAALLAGCTRARSGPAADGGRGAPAARVLKKTPWGETPVARVGDGVVTLERLRQRLKHEELEAKRTGNPPADPRAVLDALVQQEVLVQQAVREGFLASDDDVRERLVMRLLGKHEAAGRPRNPTPGELRSYYEAHRPDFPDEERLRVRHLLLKLPPDAPHGVVEAVRRRAERLLKEAARKPEAFPELASKHSEDASRGQGGELGYLPAGRWALVFGPDFGPVAAAVLEGQVGPLVRSRQGFHVFQVVERKPKGSDPLEVQRREILSRYQQEARAKQRAEIVAAMRARIPVRVDESVLEAAAAAR